ncbi:hypothetical protein CPB86DRAFT_786151 [Serendipita vermifera]|nr:hypothetical protein CPB86DRAFT_786151 [Serendipita vermifera]
MKTWDPKLAPRPFVTTEEAKRAARQIGAIDALECSAWESDTVKKVGDLLAWYGHYHHFPDNGPSSTLWSRLQALLRRRGRKKPRSG